MEWLNTRKLIGDPFIKGVGAEIGAGLHPIEHDGIEKLLFIDKRNPEELAEHFGSPPQYDLIGIDDVRTKYPDGLDFISCHHVIEHLDNPIPVISEWISLLREGGVFYMSVPSQNNSSDKGRLLTPISHIMEDFFFDRPMSSYESKQHIYSFMALCTALGGEFRPWYADNTTQDYARWILHDVAHRDEHDLHWHTMDLETARDLVDISFYVSGHSANFLTCQESEDSHYIAAQKVAKGAPPEKLAEFHRKIVAISDLCSAMMDRGGMGERA